MADLPNLVVVSSGDDSWLRDARCTIRIEAEGPTDTQRRVEDALIGLLEENPSTTSIELVSHSIDDLGGDRENLMKFGDWVVDAQSIGNFSNQLRALTQGKTLRLVGCSTAIEKPAFETLQALTATLGVDAYGTNRGVGIYDLDYQGSDPDYRDTLFIQPSQPEPRKELTIKELLGARAERVEWWSRRSALTAFKALGSALAYGLGVHSLDLTLEVLAMLPPVPAFRFPGMLTLPSESRVLRDLYLRPAGQLDYLFGGQAIRLIRIADGRTIEDLLFLVGRDEGRRRRLWEVLRSSSGLEVPGLPKLPDPGFPIFDLAKQAVVQPSFPPLDPPPPPLRLKPGLPFAASGAGKSARRPSARRRAGKSARKPH